MRIFPTSLVLAAVGIASMPAIPAGAADYDPPLVLDDAPQYVPVEVGSGWYLRGDIGYNFERNYRDRSLSVTNPFAAIAAFSPADVLSASQDEGVISGSIGMGYYFNDLLRAEAELGFLSNDRFGIGGSIPGGCAGTEIVETVNYDADGNAIDPPTITESASTRDCGASASAENSAWNAMVNAYLDLGTISGFTPYVGAGIGVAYTPSNAKAVATCRGEETTESVSGSHTTTTTFLCQGESSPDAKVKYKALDYDERQFSLAYSLSAGFAYQMGRNTKIDFGYRYLTAPDARYISVGKNGVALSKGLDYHQVRVGLRYDLW